MKRTKKQKTMFSHTSPPNPAPGPTSVRKLCFCCCLFLLVRFNGFWLFCLLVFQWFWVFFDDFYWFFNGFLWFYNGFEHFSLLLLENYQKTNLSRLRGLSGASFWTSSLKENQRKTNRKRRSAGSGAPAELMCLCSCTRNGEDRVP